MTGKDRSRTVSSTIKLSPVIWILGGSSVVYQMIAAWPLLRRRIQLRKVSSLQLLIIAYCLIYAASITAAALSGAELIRLLAALYNLSIWVAGAIAFTTVYHEDHARIRHWSRFVLIFLAIASIISYAAFSGSGSVRFSSLMGYLVGSDRLPENLAANTDLYITSADWSTLGIGSRLSIMAPYPTALGMLALVLTGLSAPDTWDRRSLLLFAPYVLIGLLLSFLCASRATMGSNILFIAVMGFFYISRASRSLDFKIFLICGSIVLCICATLLLGDKLASAWNSVNDARADSSSLRFELYKRSVSSALESHPIIGFGVKERISAYAIPLGSHSTVFGSMYKTGILGLLSVMSIFLYIALAAIKAGLTSRSLYRAGLAAASVSMLPLLLFEDIDSIPLVAYLFFVSLAILERSTQSLDEAN